MTGDKDKILLIDDEKNVLTALTRALRRGNYEIYTSYSPRAALDLVKEHSFAVVISDQRMPDMLGSQVLAEVRKISPDTKRIILTGYADLNSAIEAINQGAVNQFLSKPWSDHEVFDLVADYVKQYKLIFENRYLQNEIKIKNEELKLLNESLNEKVLLRTQEISNLNEKLKDAFHTSIKILATIGEQYSSVIGSHSERVLKIVKPLSVQLNLDPEYRFQLELAATLHDIGKVTVADFILKKKQSELKQSELSMLQDHVYAGKMIVSQLPGMEIAAEIIYSHHENYDGSGYPKKLHGKNIPLGSRILRIVDVYDKMNYSGQVVNPMQLINDLRSESGKVFDPELLEIFISEIKSGSIPKLAPEEIEINLYDLCPGMILSRDIKNSQGTLLMRRDQQIQDDHLQRVLKYFENNPKKGGVYIYQENHGQ